MLCLPSQKPGGAPQPKFVERNEKTNEKKNKDQSTDVDLSLRELVDVLVFATAFISAGVFRINKDHLGDLI